MKVKIREYSNVAVPKYEYTGNRNIFTLKITDKYKWLTLPVMITPTQVDNTPLEPEWIEYSVSNPYVLLNNITNPKSISISINNFGCLVTANGSVVCFGNNDSGQCTIPETIKTQNVKQVSCGYNHTIALLENGQMVGWGATALGMGEYGTQTIMSQISAAGLTVSKVDAGGQHGLALLSSGDVVAWGRNESAQLSDPNVYWTWPGYPGFPVSWGGGYNPQENDGFKYYKDKSTRVNGDGSGRLYRCNPTSNYDNKRYNGCESLNRSTLPQHYLWTSAGTTVYPWAYVDSQAPTAWETTTGAPYDYQFSRATTNDPTNVNYGGGGWTAASGITSALGTSAKKYTDISAGRSHNLLLAQDGKIELWGDNFYYNVTGSGSHSLAAARNCPYGLCYRRIGSGYGTYYSLLGITVDYGDNTAPTVQQFKTTTNSVSKIATSYYGNVVIKSDGTIFAWDRNECGECTNLEFASGATFAFVNGAYRHNLGIDISGNLAISGCWVGENDEVLSAPYLPTIGSSKYVWAGGSRDWSVAQLNNGSVIAWGVTLAAIKGLTFYQ